MSLYFKGTNREPHVVFAQGMTTPTDEQEVFDSYHSFFGSRGCISLSANVPAAGYFPWDPSCDPESDDYIRTWIYIFRDRAGEIKVYNVYKQGVWEFMQKEPPISANLSGQQKAKLSAIWKDKNQLCYHVDRRSFPYEYSCLQRVIEPRLILGVVKVERQFGCDGDAWKTASFRIIYAIKSNRYCHFGSYDVVENALWAKIERAIKQKCFIMSEQEKQLKYLPMLPQQLAAMQAETNPVDLGMLHGACRAKTWQLPQALPPNMCFWEAV